MSIEAILARRDLHLVMYTGSKFVYLGPKKNYRVKLRLEGEANGVELKIEHVGHSFAQTVDELWAKWQQACLGLPELAAPMIEHQPAPAVDNEIPF